MKIKVKVKEILMSKYEKELVYTLSGENYYYKYLKYK